MFKKNNNMSRTEKEVLESEILRLQKINDDLSKQLIIANKYKKDYEVLCEDYKKKAKQLEKLMRETEKIGEEKLKALKNI